MSAARLVLILLLISGGLGISVLFVSKAAYSFRDSPYRRELLGGTNGTDQKTTGSNRDTTRHRRRLGTGKPIHNRSASPSAKPARTHDRGGVFGLKNSSVLRITGLEVAGGLLMVALLLVGLTVRRLRMRKRRGYALYELHLSPHDEAKAQDLEDMVESIANIVRAWPGERARDGQPYVAVELICGAGASGMEWSINIRCQPKLAPALDAAINAAYPDVRLGRTHATHPVPRRGGLRRPGHVLRFRKERSFVYPLIAFDENQASPPLEQIALAQVALAEPSVVRFALTPTPSYFEELARRRYKRHENRLVRQERWGLPEGGLWSTLNRAEMSNAQRTQNRSLFWLEIQVAADTPQAGKTIAAAVQSRRGENRLHRRWMHIRQGLYCRRFPHALGPLLPSPRSLVSAAEAAHLLALPSARMKGVPVRRLALPRIPAPPDVLSAANADPSWTRNRHAGASREPSDDRQPSRAAG